MSKLAMWTVYDHPKDYPNNYVARRFEVSSDGPVATASIIICPDLDLLRDEMMGMGLVKLMRSPYDDPVIMETWI